MDLTRGDALSARVDIVSGHRGDRETKYCIRAEQLCNQYSITMN